jgi:butyryl-CoA:acetate CoA-transferase
MTEYKKKLISAEDAVKFVKSNDCLDFGLGLGIPHDLDLELAKRVNELKNIHIRGTLPVRELEIFKENKKDEEGNFVFTWDSWHTGAIDRRLMDRGYAYYNPIRFSELPRYYRENVERVDIAFIQVAEIDNKGYFNFGPNTSYLKAMCERAELVVVETNRNMPRCLGGVEVGIHISEVDYIVEGSNPKMVALKSGIPQETDMIIAKSLVEDIPNGACLQLGIGDMPNIVGKLIAESDIKDLGVHSEMYVDGFLELSKKNKINGSQKNIDRFRQTFTFALGSQDLYDYIDDNPEIMVSTVEYVNDVRTISSLDNFISVNNAMEIDLFGQISAETSGIRHISGAGGQLDFVLGAYLSKGGKSFICLPSTYQSKDGTLKSRITPTLQNGSVVTDTRANTHWVVTEYGKVNLKGLSTWQRAEALISIAHPDFRDELIKEAESMHIWRKTNKI